MNLPPLTVTVQTCPSTECMSTRLEKYCMLHTFLYVFFGGAGIDAQYEMRNNIASCDHIT